MGLNRKNVFLFDGVGALLSAVLSGAVLPLFSEGLGLSLGVLYSLAALACLFMVYSLGCYFFVKEFKAWMLGLIIFANSVYCLISGGLIVFYEPITQWGSLLLGFEIVVVLIVIGFEIKTFKNECALVK